MKSHTNFKVTLNKQIEECEVSVFYFGSRILEETYVSCIALHSKICSRGIYPSGLPW